MEKDKRLKGIHIAGIAGGAALLLFAVWIFIWLMLYRGIYPVIVLELGSDIPPAEVFLETKGYAEYIDPCQISRTEEDDYFLKLRCDRGNRTVLLRVRDTLAPVVTVRDRVIGTDTSLTPEEILVSVSDPSGYTAEWTKAPAFGTEGVYETAVCVTDAIGHSVTVPVTVTVVKVAREITLQAGGIIPSAARLLHSEGDSPEFVDGLDSLNMKIPGDYGVVLSCGEDTFDVLIHVEDTLAPVAEPNPQYGHTGYPMEAACFYRNLIDATEVTATYVKEPDWTDSGELPVTILLTDLGGNSTELETTVTLERENEPPSLYGVRNQTCYIGEAVAYMKDVFAADNYDASENITITVDKSNVNPRKAGTYEVIYTATDRSGNSTVKKAKFKFMEAKVDKQELEQMLNDILAEILTDEMDPVEQARAIFDYIYDTIYYSDSNEHTDWLLAAYQGLKTHRGDCFTYFSLSYLMLQRVDCQVLPIERPPQYQTRHFWCLVNFGNGWYHFDPTNRTRIASHYCFMRTTKELYAQNGGTWSWNFDASLYPEIATEKFVNPYKQGTE